MLTLNFIALCIICAESYILFFYFKGMTEMNGKSTIYENMNKFSEGVSSSSPNPLTVNERKSPQNRTENTKFSDTPQQDTIIYASLKESMLSRKPSMKFVDNEDTEYAAINIKYQVE